MKRPFQETNEDTQPNKKARDENSNSDQLAQNLPLSGQELINQFAQSLTAPMNFPAFNHNVSFNIPPLNYTQSLTAPMNFPAFKPNVRFTDSLFSNTLTIPLHEFKDIQTAHLLIENGADVNAKGLLDNTPLTLALKKNYVELSNLLIENGAEVNAQDRFGNTPLLLALENNHVEIAKLLIDHGANINDKDDSGNTPLLLALRKNYVEVAQLLIERGADVNAKDEYGNTPLQMVRDVAIAKLLIERGSNVNAQDQYGETPLLLALRNNYVEITKLLIERGADVNAKDDRGSTPLLLAFENNDVAVAQLLIDKGADVNIQDKYGGTLLHSVEDVAVAQLLIEHGADVNAQTVLGNTLIRSWYEHVSFENDIPEFVKILKLLCCKGLILNEEDYNIINDTWILDYNEETIATSYVDMAFAISNLCRLNGNANALVKPDEEFLPNDQLALMIKNIMANYILLNKVDSEYAKMIIDLCQSKGGELSEMLLNCFEEAKLQVAGKIITDIYNLKEVEISCLQAIENDQLLQIAKSAFENKVWDLDENWCNHIATQLPNQAQKLLEYLKDLRSETESKIAPLEAELLANMFEISPMPYSKLEHHRDEDSDIIKKSLEFYENNCEFKVPFAAFSEAINTLVPGGLSYLNYLMLNNSLFAKSVESLVASDILPEGIKAKLEKAIANHHIYENDPELLSSLQAHFASESFIQAEEMFDNSGLIGENCEFDQG